MESSKPNLPINIFLYSITQLLDYSNLVLTKLEHKIPVTVDYLRTTNRYDLDMNLVDFVKRGYHDLVIGTIVNQLLHNRLSYQLLEFIELGIKRK